MSEPPVYRATIERTGLALATGASFVGAVMAMLQAASGTGFAAVVFAFAVGTIVAAVLIAGVGGPMWWVTQRRGRHGPVAAASTGAAVGFVVAIAAQTGWFGLALPPTDARTLLARWVSAVAVAALAALVGAGVASAMWLVAYRRLRRPPAVR